MNKDIFLINPLAIPSEYSEYSKEKMDAILSNCCGVTIKLKSIKGKENETFNVSSVGKAGLGMTVDDPSYLNKEPK